MPDSIEDKLPIINNKESNIVNGSKLKKKILVVGDWIVDDYWVIGDHRSPKSVRTGQMHHRALHTKHASIRAFCGAGRTASLLSQAIGDDGQPLFEIIGLGIWAKNDTDSLISMFVPENTIDVNPYHLNKEKRTPPNNVHLINLGMFLEKKGEKIDYATTRVIRSYHRSGQNVRQLQRLDWELPAKYKNDKDKLPEWVQDVKVLNKKLTQYLKDIVPDFNDIDAVVIKDLGKGDIESDYKMVIN